MYFTCYDSKFQQVIVEEDFSSASKIWLVTTGFPATNGFVMVLHSPIKIGIKGNLELHMNDVCGGDLLMDYGLMNIAVNRPEHFASLM